MDKFTARQQIWEKLRQVALPDSRFHFDFSSYIADFEGSAQGTRLMTGLEVYRQAQLIFITPDNCLEDLRWQALKDGKRVLVTSYAIKRGFYLLDPAVIDPADYRYVATLDGMERLGQPVPLLLIPSLGKLDLLVTGASAISLSGVRFGKGHGFFDLEWAMLYEVGAVSLDTPVIGFGHDCQLVDIQLEATPFDTVCDYIVTNSQALRVENAPKPTVGVQWEKLQPDMLETIPPLQELRAKVS